MGGKDIKETTEREEKEVKRGTEKKQKEEKEGGALLKGRRRSSGKRSR